MSGRFVLALDQGTTSSRAVLFDEHANVVDIAQQPFEQIYPQPGWVEHDPMTILSSQLATLGELVGKHNLVADDIAAIGITNQRETTIVWDRETGEPIANAIVWQCRRSADIIEERCGDPATADRIAAITGLRPDAYFSASKIRWILDHVDGAQQRAEAGQLAFGTVDSWLLYRLTGGTVHATDYTNASRTMLFDIRACKWSQPLLDLFDIPMSMMPEALPSASMFGAVTKGPLAGVPICGIAGDQQSALFGQCCFESGQAKSTYGTGCFLLMHTGDRACESTHNLVTTIAASAPDAPHVEYALEGSVYLCGALLQWLRDGLQIIDDTPQTEELALSVPDTAGVFVVPAFTGLGAPYWDSDARGAILGLTRGVTRAHIARASLEALAYQVYDLVEAMEADAGRPIDILNVDGGVSANGFCMQFQSDVLGTPIMRPKNTETTVMGAAFLAGLTCGFWKDTDTLRACHVPDTLFTPSMDDEDRERRLTGWHDAVARVRTGV